MRSRSKVKFIKCRRKDIIIEKKISEEEKRRIVKTLDLIVEYTLMGMKSKQG